MPVGQPQAIAPETVVHRIGGGGPENLGLKATEETLSPPGISVLLGGTPAAAAEQIRKAFPDRKKFARIRDLARLVGTTTAGAIRRGL